MTTPLVDRIRVRLGGEEITSLVLTLSTQTQVNGFPRAEIGLELDGLRDVPVDWQGVVIIETRADPPFLMFTGVVEKAALAGYHPTGPRLCAVSCVSSGVVLSESTVGELAHAGLTMADVIHVLLRGNGWPAAMMNIDGSDALPIEVFEIVVPLLDVEVQMPTQIGGVRMLPSGYIRPDMIDRLPDSAMREQLLESRSVALTYVDAAVLQDALELGARRIEETLAWINTRIQDGTTFRAGRFRPFVRRWTLAHPRRDELILVRGLSTGRLLLRGSIGAAKGDALPVSQGLPMFGPPLSAMSSATDRLAWLAWDRALRPGVLEGRVQALWDCLEFYVAPAKLPSMFDRDALAGLVIALRAIALTADQRTRVETMVGHLNDPPLMTKILAMAAQDSVPLTTSDIAVLRALRKARNRTSHGSIMTDGDEKLRHGLSIAARLLAGRVERLTRAGRAEPQP